MPQNAARPHPNKPHQPGGHPDDRPPVPAGHALAWAILTSGTLLEATAYPPYRPTR